MRVGSTAVISVFVAILTVLVAAPMGLITMYLTPSTPAPTLAIAPGTIGAIGVFGAIATAGICVILAVAAAGGEVA